MEPKFDLGEVIGEGFKLYFKNIVTFVGLTLIVTGPALAIELTGIVLGDVTGQMIMLLGQMLKALLQQLVTAAIIFVVFRQLQGHTASMGEAIRYGAGRFLPVFAVGILVGILTVIGLLALLVGAFVVVTLTIFAVPVCVVERPGIIASLERSVELTKGHRLLLFGMIVILGLIVIVPGIFVGALTLVNEQLSQLLAIVVGIFTTGFYATVQSVAYLRMREVKENFGVDAIAAAFE